MGELLFLYDGRRGTSSGRGTRDGRRTRDGPGPPNASLAKRSLATHSKPDPKLGKQVVLKWDDAKRIVIVEAYLDPAQQPDFVWEILLPKISSADEMAHLSAQSQLEMGASFQSFK